MIDTVATVTVGIERLSGLHFSEHRSDLFGLHQDHWSEVAKFQHLTKVDPDVSSYLRLEKEGRLLVIIAREAGEIVGYSAHVIANHPHYRNLMIAQDDLHYLVPRLRKTGVHQRMRVLALQELKRRNVQIVTARTKFGHEHDNGLRAIGFEPMDLVYACDLTQWSPPMEG